ncbi:hypothetical protein LTR94_032308, partial [Friedmanniomyces endolithicus]
PDRHGGGGRGGLLAPGHPDAPGHGHLPDDHDRRAEALGRDPHGADGALGRRRRPGPGGPGLLRLHRHHRERRGRLLRRGVGRVPEPGPAHRPDHPRRLEPVRPERPADGPGPAARGRPAGLSDQPGVPGPGRGVRRLLRPGLSGLPPGLARRLPAQDRAHVPRPASAHR